MILYFQIIHVILDECERSKPIRLKNNNCVLQYCTEEQYNSKECVIDNSIIKTQYPNNIIFIGEQKLRYLNFITFSNGDMIFQTSSFPGNNKRIFYGLKKNGRPYFTKDDSNEGTYIYSFNCSDNQYKYESGNSIFTKEGKEYFISMGRRETYTEIFDYDNKRIISALTIDLIDLDNYNIGINLIKIDNNSYICSGLKLNSSIFTPVIIKLDLEINDLNKIVTTSPLIKIEEEEKGFGEFASCFLTEKSEILICFYGYTISNNLYYLITAYNKNLTKLSKEQCYFSGIQIDNYFYCTSFKEDAGVFIYYNYTSSEYYYPVIYFKNYNISNNSFENYFKDIEFIILDKYLFITESLSNNLMKISDNKLAFFTASKNTEKVYIVLINIFIFDNSNKIKIRYYSIEIKKLFNYKLYKDIKGYIFNDFIILGTSYCTEDICDVKNNSFNYYSTLMIIGYPNRNDSEFDIINYLLLDKSNNRIDNLIIDLSENLIIDNNIFGYIYKGIKINNITKNGNIFLKSSVSNKEIDTQIYNELKKNETLKIEFEDKKYIKSEYFLEYSYIVTEAEYEEYEKYPLNISTEYGNDNEIIFNEERKNYIGKSIYYNIILRDNLTIECISLNCLLCFEDNYSCITPKPYSENNLDDKSDTIDKSGSNNELGIGMNTSKCNKEEIINNKCINETINEEQAKFIYNYLVDKITSSNKNEIIRTKNAIFQSSTLDEQKNSNDNTISSINLGECEVLLKNKSNNPLKIIKIDIKSDDLSSTYVQYEIYDSVTGEKINLDICMDTQIKIYVPKILDNETYNNLLDSGYNIFDSNDSFYNDICTTYSSENGKDVLLSDRYQDIYIPINSMYICQDGCNFSSYNTTTQQAECNCIVNNDDINKTNIEEIIFDRMEIIRAFRNVLINSNFRVLRCYKLLFDFSKIIKNYGFIIMIVILICHLILTIIYFIKGKRKIIELINSFINLKFKIMPPLKNDKCLKSIKLKKRYKKKNQRNFNNISVGRKNPKVNNLKAETEIFNVNKNNSNKKKLNTNNSPPLKKKVNKNNNKIMNNKILKLSVKDKSSLYNSNISKIIFLTKKKEKKKNYISKSSKIKSITSEVILKDKTDIVKIPNNLVNEKYSKFLNDQELNSLEYNIAIEIDKRTYFQYYISLIKKNNYYYLLFILIKILI